MLNIVDSIENVITFTKGVAHLATFKYLVVLWIKKFYTLYSKYKVPRG